VPGSQDPESGVEPATIIHPWHTALIIGFLCAEVQQRPFGGYFSSLSLNDQMTGSAELKNGFA